MKLKTLCLVVAGLVTAALNNSCERFSEKLESKRTVNNLQITQTHQTFKETGCGLNHQEWRKITLKMPNGSYFDFVDNNLDGQLDFKGHYNSQGQLLESYGSAIFRPGKGNKVTPEHQKEFERYLK